MGVKSKGRGKDGDCGESVNTPLQLPPPKKQAVPYIHADSNVAQMLTTRLLGKCCSHQLFMTGETYMT